MTSIDSLARELAATRDIIASLESLLAEPRDKEYRIEKTIQSEMHADGVKTYEGHGLQITRQVTNSMVIGDEDALIAELKARGIYTSCLTVPRFYPKFAIKVAKEHNLPGLEMKTTETLVVTPKSA